MQGNESEHEYKGGSVRWVGHENLQGGWDGSILSTVCGEVGCGKFH